MNPWDYLAPDSLVAADTHRVLSRNYPVKTILEGSYGCVSPIFDSLAAERFARDSH